MKSTKLIDIFCSGNMVIPLFLLKNYEKWNLKIEEFVFLMYLYNLGNRFLFNPSKIQEDLNLDLKVVMNYIDVLTERGFIQVEVVKGENGLREEVILLDSFYQKIGLLVMDEISNNPNEQSDVFTMIEKEFGRTLSPIEYEIIKAWLDSNIAEDVIKEAVVEATYNGVSNLRYIDKILFEWGKAGIHSVQDIEAMRKKHNKKDADKKENIDMEIVDWNWFDEDD